MIYQDDNLFASWIQHDACLVRVIAGFRDLRMGKPWRPHEFAGKIHLAVDQGFISGDLNGDDDMDDPAEALLVNPQGFVDFLGLPLKYLGKFDLTEFDRFNTPQYWVATAWRNARTGFIHWVHGRQRPVDLDPIHNGGQGSVTVAEGAPYPLQSDGNGGLRVFEVVA